MGSGVKLRLALAAGTAVAFGLVCAAPALAGDVFLGALAHDTSFGVSGSPHESGTTDVQFGFRTDPFSLRVIPYVGGYLGHPQAYVKAQVNTSGLTNFYSIGLEWKKHLFHSHFYGGAGIGGAYVDGYNTYPDHFMAGELPPPNYTPAQFARYEYDLHIYNTRKAMGSDYVFNPHFIIGYDITPRIAVEGLWDHYSNSGFGGRNPGMDTFGGRVVYHLPRLF